MLNFPGVNTGFGGSANTTTDKVKTLQTSLVSMLQCGILYPSPKTTYPAGNEDGFPNSSSIDCLRLGLLVEDPISINCMPEAWVRAAMLIRINSLLHGASSTRPVIVDRLADLLRCQITPRVPMQGSVSASGDLNPSSYIAGCIQGKCNISVLAHGRMTTARRAMSDANLNPVVLEAKEGLAIVNGTAFSCGVGALAMHDMLGLTNLCQVLASMSVEALGGTAESFHPLFATVRPHPGQVSVTPES